MKVDFYVEFDQKKTDYKFLTDTAKEIWKSEGNKVKDLETLEMYYKPEESKCYYVFNGTAKGNFSA